MATKQPFKNEIRQCPNCKTRTMRKYPLKIDYIRLPDKSLVVAQEDCPLAWNNDNLVWTCDTCALAEQEVEAFVPDA